MDVANKELREIIIIKKNRVKTLKAETCLRNLVLCHEDWGWGMAFSLKLLLSSLKMTIIGPRLCTYWRQVRWLQSAWNRAPLQKMHGKQWSSTAGMGWASVFPPRPPLNGADAVQRRSRCAWAEISVFKPAVNSVSRDELVSRMQES